MILFTSCIYYYFTMWILICIRVYILEKKSDQVTKLIGLGAEYMVAHPNNYEQDVAKFVIFLDYYHNVYEGLNESW